MRARGRGRSVKPSRAANPDPELADAEVGPAAALLALDQTRARRVVLKQGRRAPDPGHAVAVSVRNESCGPSGSRDSISLRSQEVDSLSNKKGIVGNRWQAVANVLFTMRCETVAVGCHGLPMGLFEPFSACSHLRPVATGRARLAP
jgi:hypothetical protein